MAENKAPGQRDDAQARPEEERDDVRDPDRSEDHGAAGPDGDGPIGGDATPSDDPAAATGSAGQGGTTPGDAGRPVERAAPAGFGPLRLEEGRASGRPATSGRFDLVPPVGAAYAPSLGGLGAQGPATDRADPLMPPVGDDAPAAERPVMSADGSGDATEEPLRAVREPEEGGPRKGPSAETAGDEGPSDPAPRGLIAGTPVVARTTRPDDSGPEPAAPSDPDASRPGDPAPDPAARRVAPNPAPPPAAGAERRGGGGGLLTLLLSVLAAGAVAYGVLWFFDQQRVTQDDEAVAVVRQETDDRLAELEARLDARLGGLEEGTAALGTRLDEADARVVAAPEGAGSEALEARLDELGLRLEDFDARFAGVESGSGDAATRLEGLEGQLAGLGGLQAQLAELGERVDALYAGLPEGGEVVAPDALTPLRSALSAQDQRLAQLSERLAAVDSRLEEIGSLGEQLGALDGEVATLRDEASSGREALRQETQDARSGLSQEIATLREDTASGREALQGDIDSLRQEAQDARSGLSQEIATLRDESTSGREAIRGEIETLRQDAQEARTGLSEEVATLRDEAATDREALRGEIEAIRQRVEERAASIDAEVARARSEADVDAARARGQAAVARLQAAIEAGVPYQDLLTEVLGAVDQPVPVTLLNAAEAGVPSLDALRRDFAPAAREALQAAPSEDGRVGSFFRRQLGVRSLEAREGEEVDAILSRAEDALARGDVEAALAELEALPPEARAPVAGWIARAEDRLIVADAARDLAAQLDGG